MNKFQQVFRGAVRPLVLGMVHLEALPGTPRYRKSLDQIVEKAKWEALTLKEEGIDGIIVENMADVPYTRPGGSGGPEIVACMTRCAAEIKRSIYADSDHNLLWGIAILAAWNREALAVAKACDFDFIRVEGYVFGHVGDEGYIDGCAGQLLRYRRKIDAENVAVIADVKKKHSSHAITADVDLAQTIHAAEFFLADGVIVTGSATGQAPAESVVQEARRSACRIPILVGSGVTYENVHKFSAQHVDGFVVGSDFKEDGDWEKAVDRTRVRRFVNRVREIAGQW